MSLITRCPACETMFKVVPDQLRISDGWVRCGQCGEIFDASLHLLAHNSSDAPPVRQAELVATPKAATAPSADVAAGAAGAAERSASGAKLRTEVPPVVDAPPTAVAGEPMWIDLAVPDPDPDPDPEPHIDPPAEQPVLLHGTPAEVPSQFPLTRPEAEDEPPSPSFMRENAAPSVWKRPIVRVVLVALLLLLLAVLAAQILFHERDRIASIEPATRPLLLALCGWARCEVSPLRQIDSIVIDSSSFTRDRGDNYRLGFSLRNNAAIDVAMPAIELSVTDSQDQSLFRRVIRPAEFGAPSNLLGAGADWGNTLILSIKATGNAERVSGYRLLAFYP